MLKYHVKYHVISYGLVPEIFWATRIQNSRKLAIPLGRFQRVGDWGEGT